MNKIYTIITVIFFLTISSFANSSTVTNKKLELINMISQQQVLAQRISKAYIYAKKKIGADANKQLRDALSSFYKTYSRVNMSTKSPKIRNMMAFVKKSSKEFQKLSKKPLNSENSKKILALSEQVLAKSKKVLKLLKASLKKYELVSKSGQQQVLAEKIANYYISYQSNPKDKTIIKKMNRSIAQFAKNHKKLMKNRSNTKKIKKKLKEVDKLWKIVRNLYNGGELSSIIFTSTEDIAENMKEVTKLYMAEYR